MFFPPSLKETDEQPVFPGTAPCNRAALPVGATVWNHRPTCPIPGPWAGDWWGSHGLHEGPGPNFSSALCSWINLLTILGPQMQMGTIAAQSLEDRGFHPWKGNTTGAHKCSLSSSTIVMMIKMDQSLGSWPVPPVVHAFRWCQSHLKRPSLPKQAQNRTA